MIKNFVIDKNIIIMGICSGISMKWLLIHCFHIKFEFRSVNSIFVDMTTDLTKCSS